MRMWLVNPAGVMARHDELAAGLDPKKDESPIPIIVLPPERPIAVKHSLRELKRRCPECRKRINREVL